MPAEVKIPQLGESVTEGVIVRWLKEEGADVAADEPVLELETEKAAMEVSAEAAGRLHIVKPVGARVRVGEVVATIEAAGAEPRAESAAAPRSEPAAPRERAADEANAGTAASAKAERDEAEPAAAHEPTPAATPARKEPQPVAWRAGAAAPPADGHGEGNGHGREPQREVATVAAANPAAPEPTKADVERVPMSELRRTVAARLVEARQTAAILSTFNEIDLGDLLAARARNRERFKARHGIDLGLMSLFARATVLALREVPIVNARIEGDEIVQPRRVHLGIAVSTRRGLVVPVVRDADTMSVGDLERAIGERATRAREGKLRPDDLAGGTFTITNGGVFGSLLSTPLLNPPQSGILGMHAIQERPVARAGQVVIRPMMYVALSYDHRLVDGEQAVTFLKRIKELLEDPARMAFDS